MSCRLIALCILLGLSFMPLSSFGQTSSKENKNDREQAAFFFEEAERFYKLQKFQEALEKYEQAYLLSAEPALLFNIGQCYRLLGRYEEAIKSYKTFLRDVPADDASRATAKRILKELEARESTPESVSVTKTSNEPSPEEALEVPISTSVREKERQSSLSPSAIFYGSAAVSGVGGLVIGGLSLSAMRKGKRFEEAADFVLMSEQYKRGKALGLVADVLFGAAILSAGIGYLSGRKGSKSELTLSLSPMGAVLSGRY